MDHTFFLFITIIGAFFFIGGIILAIWDDDSDACNTRESILFGSALLFLSLYKISVFDFHNIYRKYMCYSVWQNIHRRNGRKSFIISL